MTLREKQALFSTYLARLVLHIFETGYSCTFGEFYRSPHETARLAKAGLGSRNSLHTMRLAADLNLFTPDGDYVTKSELWLPFGEWWERQHPLARWGGRFQDSRGKPRPDGNHFSFTHEGRA